jgi:isocitrate dehydrogenase
VRYLPGLPSPLKSPERIDLTIFRENTEDVYCGVEWPADSPEAKEVIDLVNTRLMPKKRPLAAAAAIGIKPITRRASERLVRAAIRYAVRDRRPSVTLVHKGNIMKFTEGGFLKWGYELAKAEFGDAVVTERELKDCGKTLPPAGKILLKDRIADNMFQELILKPDEHSVIATTNLNGDYLSDAAAALIGGLGFAAGANFSDELAVFEAVHGAAPDIACQDVANPSAMMLTQRELLAHLGWHEAADRLFGAVKAVVSRGWVTADVACYLPNVTPLSCSEFAAAVCEEIAKRTG